MERKAYQCGDFGSFFKEGIETACRRMEEADGKTKLSSSIWKIADHMAADIEVTIENARALEPHIAHALEEGMIVASDFSIDKMVKIGYYDFLELYMSENLVQIAYNVLAKYAEANGIADAEEKIESVIEKSTLYCDTFDSLKAALRGENDGY